MTLYTTQLIGKPHCPICQELLDAASSEEEGAKPEPESIMVCIYCQSILVFTEEMSLSPMTQAEYDELPSDVANMLSKYKVCSVLASVSAKSK